MTGVYLQTTAMPDEATLKLFEAWLQWFSEKRLDLTQSGSGGSAGGRTVTIGSPTDKHFVLRQSGPRYDLESVVGLDVRHVQSVLDLAASRTQLGDIGDGVIFKTEMTVGALDILSSPMHFMRMLGDQVHIEGSRRISDVVILDFEERLPADTTGVDALFAPESKIQATIFAPGPCPSDLAREVAAGVTETTAAICAFATGRPVQYQPPMFPVTPQTEVRSAQARRTDQTILGLARDGISLDVFGDLYNRGGPDSALRVRGSLLAYHAALNQSAPDVAVMLLVTCIEALISPRGSWGKTKVTQRFIKALIQLCSDAVDTLLGHGNVEEAFDYKRRGGLDRQRRELLDRIYQARSLPTHTGIAPSPGGFMTFGHASSMRVALLSDLARAAVLSYIQAPRSSLVGHPGVDRCDERTSR